MPPVTTLDSVRDAIATVDGFFADAFNAGDPLKAARGVYTEEAIALPPGGEMVRGRESIAQFWQGAREQLGIERVDLSTVELELSGEFAHQVGRAALTLAGGQNLPCKYVVIWKQEDGRWKWHIDIWNTDR